MARDYFYHGTTKTIVVAFATIFDEIVFKDGFDRTIKVPLHYSTRSKWLEHLQAEPELDDGPNDDIIFPRMGFELTGLSYAPERHTNPLNRINDSSSDSHSESYMYNRVPYDFAFDLNVATVRFEDCLKIVEQIVPFFTPELNLTIRDRTEFQMDNNIPVVLNSVGIIQDYEGDLNSRRIITSTLQFTVKGYLYSNIRESNRIKKTVLNLHQKDFEDRFIRLTSEVDPIEAKESDPHTIVDTLYEQ